MGSRAAARHNALSRGAPPRSLPLCLPHLPPAPSRGLHAPGAGLAQCLAPGLTPLPAFSLLPRPRTTLTFSLSSSSVCSSPAPSSLSAPPSRVAPLEALPTSGSRGPSFSARSPLPLTIPSSQPHSALSPFVPVPTFPLLFSTLPLGLSPSRSGPRFPAPGAFIPPPWTPGISPPTPEHSTARVLSHADDLKKHPLAHTGFLIAHDGFHQRPMQPAVANPSRLDCEVIRTAGKSRQKSC